jgi:hypothetical protein
MIKCKCFLAISFMRIARYFCISGDTHDLIEEAIKTEYQMSKLV